MLCIKVWPGRSSELCPCPHQLLLANHKVELMLLNLMIPIFGNTDSINHRNSTPSHCWILAWYAGTLRIIEAGRRNWRITVVIRTAARMHAVLSCAQGQILKIHLDISWSWHWVGCYRDNVHNSGRLFDKKRIHIICNLFVFLYNYVNIYIPFFSFNLNP